MNNKHSSLSPSSSSRWLKCTASVGEISRTDVEEIISEPAIEGTKCHELAEHCLKTDSDPMKVEGDYDDEMRQCIVEYVQYIKDYNFTSMQVEVKLPLFYAPLDTGTADVIGVKGNVLYVVDLKYGQQVKVEVKDNTQLIIYAISALKLHRGIDFVVTVIHQSRMNNIASAVYSLSELDSHETSIIEQAKKTQDTPEFNPSEEACKYCIAKASCKALGSHLETIVGKEFANLDEPEEMINERLSLILDNKKLITDWLKAVELKARAALQQGATVPGYKLVSGKGRRAWSSTQELVAILQDDAYERVLLSPAKVEKLVKQKRIEKELRKSLLFRLKEIIIYNTGAETVVPVGDKRKAIENLTFKALEEEG